MGAPDQVLAEVDGAALGAGLLHLQRHLGAGRPEDHAADLVEVLAGGEDVVGRPGAVQDRDQQVAGADLAAGVGASANDCVEHGAAFLGDLDRQAQPHLSRRGFVLLAGLPAIVNPGEATDKTYVHCFPLSFQSQNHRGANVARQKISDFNA